MRVCLCYCLLIIQYFNKTESYHFFVLKNESFELFWDIKVVIFNSIYLGCSICIPNSNISGETLKSPLKIPNSLFNYFKLNYQFININIFKPSSCLSLFNYL